MKFLSVEEVIEIHDDAVSRYGGLHGIRDMGLLVSAIEMPKATMFGEDLHSSVYDKASAYLFHIVCNHPFIDGNKRTGSASTLVFLEENKIQVEFSIDDFEELVCGTAQGLVNKAQISHFFSKQISLYPSP